jgi:hypothetical protein
MIHTSMLCDRGTFNFGQQVPSSDLTTIDQSVLDFDTVDELLLSTLSFEVSVNRSRPNRHYYDRWKASVLGVFGDTLFVVVSAGTK